MFSVDQLSIASTGWDSDSISSSKSNYLLSASV